MLIARLEVHDHRYSNWLETQEDLWCSPTHSPFTPASLSSDEPLLERVVFGSSCFGNPLVTRITIEDGKQGWYSREAEVCLARGTDETADKCVWFFEDYGDFKKFPIRQGDIQRLLQ